MKTEDLAGLEDLLAGNPGTVMVPQEVFRKLVDELKARSAEEELENSSKAQQLRLKVHKIIARIEVLHHDNHDREICWLARYTKHLLAANMELLFHLERLTSDGFAPRVKLETALKDEVPEGKRV